MLFALILLQTGQIEAVDSRLAIEIDSANIFIPIDRGNTRRNSSDVSFTVTNESDTPIYFLDHYLSIEASLYKNGRLVNDSSEFWIGFETAPPGKEDVVIIQPGDTWSSKKRVYGLSEAVSHGGYEAEITVHDVLFNGRLWADHEMRKLVKESGAVPLLGPARSDRVLIGLNYYAPRR